MANAATKTKPVAQRVAPRASVAPQTRAERPSLVPTDRVVATGRDGKPIWRKTQDDLGQYDHAADLQPDGWKYEWKRKSVYGWEDVQHQVNLRRNGWTDVPASRHDGVWMPAGYPGNIEIEGRILMEIPIELWKEAKVEEKRKADRQVGDSRRSAGMAPSSVADPSHPEARRSTYVRKEAAVPVANQNKYDYTLDE